MDLHRLFAFFKYECSCYDRGELDMKRRGVREERMSFWASFIHVRLAILIRCNVKKGLASLFIDVVISVHNVS